MERLLIRQALEETGGTVSRAADLLKMSKTLLAQKMRKHRISAADIKAGRPAGSG
jgi:DNA-binding NtrC family response regulator